MKYKIEIHKIHESGIGADRKEVFYVCTSHQGKKRWDILLATSCLKQEVQRSLKEATTTIQKHGGFPTTV